ncbi:hypothetical protein FNF27_05432 [Cafeteria roenbergensis]|nr:hypothetical protein FNF31_01022 [Cafeteria roenbergensis]KAA0173083.1 hypothetical protein FNF27_05432 [Cafeteria roenbergensis]
MAAAGPSLRSREDQAADAILGLVRSSSAGGPRQILADRNAERVGEGAPAGGIGAEVATYPASAASSSVALAAADGFGPDDALDLSGMGPGAATAAFAAAVATRLGLGSHDAPPAAVDPAL